MKPCVLLGKPRPQHETKPRQIADVLMRSQDRAPMSAAKPLAAGDLRLVDIFLSMRERKGGVLAVTVAVFLAMSIVVVLDEPVYRAYVSVAPAEPLIDNRTSTLAGSLLGFGGGKDIGLWVRYVQ